LLNDKADAVLKTVTTTKDGIPLSSEEQSYVDKNMNHEIQILQTLPPNNNIVKYISDEQMHSKGFAIPTIPHYYLEYCENGDLSSYNEFDITDVYRQVFSGLKHLYENYIIHSDIKEDNVLVTMVDGKPIYKIADFGLSVDIKTLQKDTDGKVDQLSLFINATPLYRPSYLKYTTYFRDLYALFCMLFYLQTGKNFNTNDKQSKLIKLCHENTFSGLNYIFKFYTYLIGLESELLTKYNDPTSGQKIIKIIPGADGYEPNIVRGKIAEGERLTINVEDDHKQYAKIYNSLTEFRLS
jgi:serine/threonine protein kinase